MTVPLAIACGGVLIDSVVTADGTVNEGALGGNAVYAAAGLRLWLDTEQVGIVGHVPANYPEALLDELRSHGILTDGIRRSHMRVRGPEWFFYAPDGSRRDEMSSPADGDLDPDFASFRRSHPIRPADLPARWHHARGVHLGGNDPDALLALAQAIPSARITLDPGARAADLAAHPNGDAILDAVTAVIPSLRELAILSPGLGTQAALAALRGTLALVKRGADGVLLRQPAASPLAVPALKVAAVDPTGAGDSFCGGFLAGLLLGDDPATAAAMGTRIVGAVAASFAIEGFGPHSLLQAPRAERDRRLADLLTLIGRSAFLPTETSIS